MNRKTKRTVQHERIAHHSFNSGYTIRCGRAFSSCTVFVVGMLQARLLRRCSFPSLFRMQTGQSSERWSNGVAEDAVFQKAHTMVELSTLKPNGTVPSEEKKVEKLETDLLKNAFPTAFHSLEAYI